MARGLIDKSPHALLYAFTRAHRCRNHRDAAWFSEVELTSEQIGAVRMFYSINLAEKHAKL